AVRLAAESRSLVLQLGERRAVLSTCGVGEPPDTVDLLDDDAHPLRLAEDRLHQVAATRHRDRTAGGELLDGQTGDSDGAHSPISSPRASSRSTSASATRSPFPV